MSAKAQVFWWLIGLMFVSAFAGPFGFAAYVCATGLFGLIFGAAAFIPEPKNTTPIEPLDVVKSTPTGELCQKCGKGHLTRRTTVSGVVSILCDNCPNVIIFKEEK